MAGNSQTTGRIEPYPGNPLTRRDKLACALADTVCMAFANHSGRDPVPGWQEPIPVWDWWRARFNETLELQGVKHEW